MGRGVEIKAGRLISAITTGLSRRNTTSLPVYYHASGRVVCGVPAPDPSWQYWFHLDDFVGKQRTLGVPRWAAEWILYSYLPRLELFRIPPDWQAQDRFELYGVTVDNRNLWRQVCALFSR